MKVRGFSVFVLPLVLSLSAVSARADILGDSASYAVLATTTVTNPATNLASTVITGDMGGTSCTGFVAGTGCTLGFGTVSGTASLGDANWVTALAASNIAYTALMATPSTFDFTGFCLGSSVGCLDNLAPGVYSTTDSVANLMGALTLAGGGNLAPLWIFQTAAGFVTASDSSVVVDGTGADNAGIYFAVGSQATLGDNTSFIGNILAGTAVVFNPGAQITCGRAFTDTAAGTQVTFAGNNPATESGTPNLVSGTCAESTSGYNSGVLVTTGGGTIVGPGPDLTPIPEPGPVALLSAALLAMVLLKSRKARVNSLSV